jgi:chlorobactene glucosyltransferase
MFSSIKSRLRSHKTQFTRLWRLVSHLVALSLLARMSFRLIANLRFLQAARRIPSLPARPLPYVSVLVPARNEAATIAACVTSLLSQTYPKMDVLVLDDGSTDGTSQQLDALSRQYPQLTVIYTTNDPPSGWNGKSYACHRLAQRATGEWLLFTDADTIHAPTSVERGVIQACALDADLLSAFPFQRVETWSERFLVSFVMNFLPLTTVNLAAMWRGRSRHLLANGQYLLARAKIYDALGGHASVAHALVDDFALARRFSVGGYTVALVDGASMLECRMYRSFREVWEGFSKNLLIALASSPAFLSPAASFTSRVCNVMANLLRTPLFAWGYACVFVLPFVRLLRYEQRSMAIFETCWLLLLRSVVARQLKRPPDEIVTTPLAAWGVMAICLGALFRRWRGRRIAWKGRLY